MISAATPGKHDRILGGLWGSLVGDALGVPVEFMHRSVLQAGPVQRMRGFGTYDVPPGTWSDDGALLLCSADSLCQAEFDLADMGDRFVRWLREALWTATGEVFEVGLTTRASLRRIETGTPAAQAGAQGDDTNGNGSLMRILPVALRFAGQPMAIFAARLEAASAITHGHALSRMACVFYGLVIRQLLAGHSPAAALATARGEFTASYASSPALSSFTPVLHDDLATLPSEQVKSGGFVLETLHASLWCLLQTQNFYDCVLTAVNLGGDTDTTGCVAGGLAGVPYGRPAIPAEWVGTLPRQAEIEALFKRLAARCAQ